MPNDEPCQSFLDEYNEAREEWQDSSAEDDELREEVFVATGELIVACGGAAAASGTIVGGVVGGGACILTMWNLVDKAGDCDRARREAESWESVMNSRAAMYQTCMENHKLWMMD